jgi:hypothetical protein
VADVEEKVMKFVEDTLKKRPKIQLDELFEQAKKVSASVGRLTKRQFNARYPLQVKRRRAQASRKGTTPRRRKPRAPTRSAEARQPDAAASRDEVRRILLQFAMEIVAADERKDLVKVLAGVDLVVDRVFKGVTKA